MRIMFSCYKTKSISLSSNILLKSVVELGILYFFASKVDDNPWELARYFTSALILLRQGKIPEL